MLEQITGFMNVIFSPISTLYPPVAVAFLAAFFTIFIFVCNRLLVKRSVIESIRKRMDEIREQITTAQQAKNVETIEKWLKEMVELNNQYIKHMLKGLVIAIAVSIIVLPWISTRYAGAVVRLPFEIPFLGSSLTGTYWYMLVSFVVGWVINKMLGG